MNFVCAALGKLLTPTYLYIKNFGLSPVLMP